MELQKARFRHESCSKVFKSHRKSWSKRRFASRGDGVLTLELTKRSASWWSVAFQGGHPGPAEPKSEATPSMQKLEAKIGEQVVTKWLEIEIN